MDFKEIKKLVELVEAAQISHLGLEEEGVKIEIKKELPQQNTSLVMPATAQQAVVPAPVPAQVTAQSPSTSNVNVEVVDSSLIEVKAQMVGTYYDSPNPDSPPFCKVGDSIKSGQVLCIIEAMKLFNEIESEVNGTVEKVCVNVGDSVEFGQVLFLVKP